MLTFNGFKLSALFIYYFEKGLRTNKFGVPAGVFSANNTRPANVEAYYHKTLSKALSLEALDAVDYERRKAARLAGKTQPLALFTAKRSLKDVDSMSDIPPRRLRLRRKTTLQV